MRRLTVVLVALVACNRPEPSGPSASPPTPPAASAPMVMAPRDAIRWMPAPGGVTDVAAAVREVLGKERAEGRTLLVYVGATWCEPCQRFHHAVEQGELDAAFPRLSVLAFDTDRDGEVLASAGYLSRLIPLFALPRDDGHASGKQIEGSVKGAAAVGEITPRLRALIAGGT
jgi:thiol-disulfide isomerase/thioredoxin